MLIECNKLVRNLLVNKFFANNSFYRQLRKRTLKEIASIKEEKNVK